MDLRKLPDWVKSFGLPPEAVAAIDRWWQPVWDASPTSCSCSRPTRAAPRPAPEAADPVPTGRVRAVPGRARRRSGRRRFDERCGPPTAPGTCSEGEAARPDLATCRAALDAPHARARRRPTSGSSSSPAATTWPPGCCRSTARRAFIVGCSQGAWTRGDAGARAQLRLPRLAARGHRLPDGVDGPPRDRDERLPVGPARRHQRRRARRLAHVRRAPRRRRRLRDPARRPLPARDLRDDRRGARRARARSPSTRRRTSRCSTAPARS